MTGLVDKGHRPVSAKHDEPHGKEDRLLLQNEIWRASKQIFATIAWDSQSPATLVHGVLPEDEDASKTDMPQERVEIRPQHSAQVWCINGS